MRIELLEKLTGEWAVQWTIAWFSLGAVALISGFWLTTSHSILDWFYLIVSVLGLICVAALAFRKNLLGNGLATFVNAGEVVVHMSAGSVGLALSPLYNLFSHIYGFVFWSRNTDSNGNVLPQSATKSVWFATCLFIALGLVIFPYIYELLIENGLVFVNHFKLVRISQSGFYWLNIMAFILAITAQTAMILRYRFSWWIWFITNFINLAVNVLVGNYIFAVQTMIFQLNTVIAIYEWHRYDPK